MSNGILIDLFDNDFSQPNRQRHNVYQRAVYFRLCRDLTPYALTDIGEVDITIATNFSFLMQLRTLAHELIHARQFFAGQLSSDLTAWKDKDYSKANYEDQPWEIEAHKYEDQLFMASFPWSYDV